MSIAFVVPCYNESERTDFSEFKNWQEFHPEVEFYFVNDGSSDETYAVLNSFFDAAHIVHLETNVGKAEAVRVGMKYVCGFEKFSHVGFLDADMATPLSQIPLFQQCVEEGKEIIIGSRILRLGGEVKRKRYRHYLGRFFATAASVLLDLPVYDTQCGAKLFNRKALSSVLDEPFTSKWIFDVELFLRMKIQGDVDLSQWYEVPLEKWEDVAGSRLKPMDFLKAPFEMISLYRKYGRG